MNIEKLYSTAIDINDMLLRLNIYYKIIFNRGIAQYKDNKYKNKALFLI